ncbi:MAG TPA: bifunctional oligoribonuclease/PAP phosphatase NrnA [Clostridia bacterium]|nr:bifunctional oligoribonuclease/PAP phosphatase NrnA [Clostridia bacterium]
MGFQQVKTPAYQQRMDEAVRFFTSADKILILSHLSPDGDTLGSAFALCRALLKMGKKARVICSDPFPEKFKYMYDGLEMEEFSPAAIVSVDIASRNLFGRKLEPFTDKVDFCIDHHPSNTGYAARTLLNPEAAATCEIILELVKLLGVEINNFIADCIYTGLATDTGCFRYSNTTPQTLRCAAEMMERGAQAAKISKRMFETLSRPRLEMERQVLNSLEYYYEGKVALVYVTREMCEKTGVPDSDLEGIPSIPVRIEGVLAGITIKEKSPEIYKISLRTNSGVNASEICSNFGGGGHAAAAGCQIEGSLAQVREKILEATGKALDGLK